MGLPSLSSFSTNFVISTAWAASNRIRPFLPGFWEHTSDLHLPLDDAVHAWLVVSSFSGAVFAVVLGAG
jgi:hypothetical protein